MKGGTRTESVWKTTYLRVVRMATVDYLTVSGAQHPGTLGFVERDGRWWRPGWWGVLRKAGRGSRELFMANADRDARVWPQPWGDAMRVTRVDVCVDISGFAFTDEHRLLFTTRGTSQAVFRNHEVRTLYLGSRESPMMLRVYLKSARCTDADREHWARNGWDGTTPVWRVEYEFHRKALPPTIELPRDALALLNDGLARVRMCTAPPRSFGQQNKAPTHPLWMALGKPARLTRRRSELAADSETTRGILESLTRLMVRAGYLHLPAMRALLNRTR